MEWTPPNKIVKSDTKQLQPEYEDMESHFLSSYPKLIDFLCKSIRGNLIGQTIKSGYSSIYFPKSGSLEYLLDKSYSTLSITFIYISKNKEIDQKSWSFDIFKDEDFMIKTINEYIQIYRLKHLLQHNDVGIFPQLLESDSESQLSNTDTTKKKEGCYIATACYGNYDTPELLAFRKFRDKKLKKTIYGRYFINVYYLVSPSLVKLIGNNIKINIFIRKYLDKFYIYLLKNNNT